MNQLVNAIGPNFALWIRFCRLSVDVFVFWELFYRIHLLKGNGLQIAHDWSSTDKLRNWFCIGKYLDMLCVIVIILRL